VISRRLSAGVAAGALVLAALTVSAAIFRPDRAIRVATGFVAQTACANIFVSGFDPQTVFEETADRDGIRRLRRVLGYRLDRAGGTVDASVAGWFGSRAAFHDGFGCVLLHGPNGSAKSTFVSCLARALEYYSTLDEGALYRFNWIFPSQKLQKGGIGFGGGYDGAPGGSFAYLDDDLIDARLVDELRDNPLLLPARVPPLFEKSTLLLAKAEIGSASASRARMNTTFFPMLFTAS